MTLLSRAVTLPPTPAVGGGILDQARALPDGWTRGLAFATEACLIAGEHLFCTDSPTDKDFQSSDLAEFAPYGVEVGVVCTTLGGARAREEREARANQALSVKIEGSVGQVLATGLTTAGDDTGNPSLADATSLSTEDDEISALGVLENAIASNLMGMLAWVHMTPAHLVELVACNVVRWDEFVQAWRTPTGHVVVASPGYVGNIDNELVATTEVYASVGDIDEVRTVDREDNRYLALHEAPALAVFDPCFNVSVGIETSPA